MVAVVQLVEPQVVILVVAGSSPVSHPIDLPHLLWYVKLTNWRASELVRKLS